MDARQSLVQNNMENYWKLASKTSHITLEINGKCVHTTSLASDHFLNSVLSVKLSNSDADNNIVDLENFYSQREKSFCWWVFPNKEATKLSTLLESHQFNNAGIIDGMILPDIGKIDFNFELPGDVTIKKAKTDEEFNLWIKPLTISFDLSEAGSNTYESIYMELSKQTDKVEHYVAYQGSNPVSSCSLFLDRESNTAGIYNCGTIPEARKQGICSALTKHGLFSAHQKGFKTAALQATNFSKKLFEEIGFESCTSYKLYYK